MKRNRLVGLTPAVVTFAVTMAPSVALAAEEGAKAASGDLAVAGKAIGAGLAMGLSALAAGMAQGRIGSAGAGTIAERPETSTMILVLEALPEIIVLLGLVVAYLILKT